MDMDLDHGEMQVYETVRDEIARRGLELVVRLNSQWRRLGVRPADRLARTRGLVPIVQERYDEVLQETADRLATVTDIIRGLREKIDGARRALSISEAATATATATVFAADAPLNLIKESLEAELLKYSEQLETRMKKMTSLEEWEKNLCDNLGTKPHYICKDPLPDEDKLRLWSLELAKQQDEYEKRVDILQKKRAEIRCLLDELEINQHDQFQFYVLNTDDKDFRTTDSNMNRLLETADNLSRQLDDHKAELLEIRKKIRILWERLDEDAKYCDSFLAKHVGHGRRVRTALLEELERCEEKKKHNFKMIIVKVRNEIEDLWNKCMYSLNRRDKFVEFHSSVFNEDLLALHEMYLKDLQDFYEENCKLFELFATRQQLWTKWNELDARSKEPGRFTNRGGQLLLEEKERKAVTTQLPKIEKELTALAQAYEEKNNKSFEIYGENLLTCMSRDWEENKKARLLKSSARKQHNLITSSLPSNRALYMSKQLTATTVKSPSGKSIRSVRCMPRRLYTTQTTSLSNRDAKKTAPHLLVNGHPITKKKHSMRKSKEFKRKSKNFDLDISNQDVNQVSLASYAGFQDYVDSNVDIRSSSVEMCPKTPSSALSPIGESGLQLFKSKKNKENILPETPQQKTDVFATPRPKKRALPVAVSQSTGKRYNTRYSSSHNIRSPFTPTNSGLKIPNNKLPFLI